MVNNSYTLNFVLVILVFIPGFSVFSASDATQPVGIRDLRDATPEERDRLLERMRQEREERIERWHSLPEEEREAIRQRNRRIEENQARRLAESRLFNSLSDEERKIFVEKRLERIRAKTAEKTGMALAEFVDVPESPGTGKLSSKPERAIDQWQFISVVRMGGDQQFSLRNPWEDLSFWATLGETREGIRIIGFSPGENALEISDGTDSKQIPLGGSGLHAEVDVFELAQNPENWKPAFQDFFGKWRLASKTEPSLRELDQQFKVIAAKVSENRNLMRQLGREDAIDSQERARRMRDLTNQNGALFAKAEKITGKIVNRLEEIPGFSGNDLEIASRMTRPMLMVYPLD